MNNYFLDAVSAVLVPTIPVVGAYVVNFLNAHIGQKNAETLEKTAFTVVQAVEQMADSNQIDKSSKFGTAISTLEEFFPKESEMKLRQHIEAAVVQVNRSKLFTVGIAEPLETEAPAVDTAQQI